MKNKTKFYERIISIATMLTIVASVMIFVPRTSVNDTLAIEPIGEEVGSQTTKVFSYEQVFQSY